jgi:putative PIN family toxin of toxin-antitoxin system
MKVVLDTNVIVSALLSPSGSPASVLTMVLRGSVSLLIDNRILFEYTDVLHREKFNFPRRAVDPLLDFFKASTLYVSAAPTSANLPDKDDRPFYEVAISGGADFLITGNKSHFPRKPIVVTPKQFLDMSAGKQ